MGLFETGGLWLVSIGKTTVHSLWLGLLILALLKLVLTFIPAGNSRLRYNLSVAALLLLFISIITTFLLLHEPITPLQKERVLARGMAVFPGDAGVGAAGSSFIFTLFACIYLAGTLFMLVKTASSFLRLGGLRRNATLPDLFWQKRFVQLCSSLGIKRSVDFFQTTRIKTPMLMGYLKPVILVPAGMITHLPVDQVETILLHELYHLKRGDFLINILQLFMESVLFYHPVVWIISGYIRSEREHCCDDRVLYSTDNPYTYAKALIQLAVNQQTTRLVPGAAGKKKHQLHIRINRIINNRTMKATMRDKAISLALLAGSVFLLLAISGFSAGPSIIKGHMMHTAFNADSPEPSPMLVVAPDTIPGETKSDRDDEISEQDWEKMKAEMEAAHQEVREAMENIDWDSIKAEMEAARKEASEAMEEIDWDSMKAEMEAAREEARKAMKEIDWDAMKVEMEAARKEARRAMEDIDWEEIRAEMEKNLSEMKIDMEKLKLDIQNSMDELDWDKIRDEMEKSRVFLDSIRIEMDQ
jgi:bla regulator protein blaR1